MDEQHIPFALVNNELRSASSVSKNDGPFQCIVCSESLVLKKGLIKRAHFAHSANSSCSGGGGESVCHALAKRIMAKNLQDYSFMEVCTTCGSTMRHTGKMDYIFQQHFSYEEYKFGKYKLDVGVVDINNTLIAAIEIFHTHLVDDTKAKALKDKGIIMIELVAEQILTAYENNAFLLVYNTKQHCYECVEKQKVKQDENRKKEFVKENKKCIQCGKWIHLSRLLKSYPPPGYQYGQSYVCTSCVGQCVKCKSNASSQQLKEEGMCNVCLEDKETSKKQTIEHNCITNYFVKR